MPNKITYTITTSDGKSHQVDEQNINKYGMQSYADAYKGATIRMRDKDGADYDIPLNRFTQARGQGLRPFRFEHRGTSANTQAGSHAQQVVDEYDESVRRTQPRMTAAQKAKMSNWASSFGQNVGQTTKEATQALKRQNDARKDNALRVRRENVGVDATPYKLGENPNVVETGSTYNRQSGKVEKTYLTEVGNEYVGRDVADLEQNIIDDQKAREMDPVNTALRDAYAERDRLDEAMRQRMQEIDDGNKGVGSILRELAEGSKQPGSFNPLQQYQTDEQYRQLEAAARKNRATIQTLEDKRDNKMNDFFHSIATTAANGYTFNDGLAEINDAIALLDARKHINSINRKQTTGEPLTEEEQAAASVLAADAVNAEVQGQYAGDYGAWARAGQMVPTSIDLMKDIMLTPGAGGVAKGVAGKVAGIGTRFLAKQAGETAAKSAAKAIGRGVLKGTGILLGAHTAGAVVSNTAGIGRTIGAMGTNLAGQTVKDAQGNYKVQDSMDVLDAFVDAERNQIRETGSEMFGEFLPGAGGLIKKGLEKIGLSKISNALTNIGNKQWYQQYNRLLTAGGYNGIPGEALEEYEGMAFDALTGNAGETWQQLKDPRTHVDIWLGTAAMSALLGAAPVTIQGAHTAMYYRYKHATDKADRTAAYRFGDNEKWNGLKDVIDNTPNEDMANAVMDIMNDSSLYPEQKTAALNYVRNLTKMRGYNIGQMSNANEESEESKAANESYANGYNTENPEELNQIKNRYEVAREKALQAFPQETLDEIENDNSLILNVEAPTLRKIVVDYLNTKQAYDGMIQRVRDDIDTQVQQSNDMIESRINKTTGMIQPAMMKAPDENGNERRAYVISGNVEMLADMSGVDREKSDGSILVRYADTGEMEMVSPSAIMRVDDAISPEQEQQESETNITQTYAQQKANEIDGKVAFAQGDVYTLTDEAGKVAQVTVVPNKDGIVDNGDGTVNVDAGTGEVVAMPKDAIQIMIDRTNKNKVVPQEEPAAAVTYNLNDDVYVQDENGNIVHGVITGDVNEDGQYEVQTDTPVKNVLVNLYTPDQFVQQPQATTTEQPAAEQTPAEQATEQQPANEQQAEQTQAATAQEEQKSAIPTDEKGNMLYHQVPVETTINDLYDGKLDDNEIRDFVDVNISEADKNLEKVNKKAPKIGTNKAEYLKKKQEWQKQVEDATRIRDYWNSVKNYIAQQTHTTPEEVKAAQDELSGEAARREYQDMSGSVQQDAVSVASDFIRGAKITPESFKAETGYGTDEQRKFVGMIAKAENGGKTIDRLAEELVSYDNAEMNGVLFGGDTSSAKDAILSALQGAGTRGELKQTNEVEEQAYIDARNAARDAQYMEQYGMTYEEYLAYEEQITPTIWREYNNYDETAFNNMYAEEIEQLLKSRENDTTGEKPTDDRGNKVLPEQQVNQQPGSEGSTEPGREIQAGVQGNNENAVAPEEASGERIPNIERGRQGYTGYIARRQQNNLETSEEINVPLSQNEQDEYGNPMVLAENGSTVFGTIESESGLTEAPIKLSLGENKVGTDGKNHGYGLLHIEAGHGEQIRNAGYQSVEQFVENVAQNYTDIKEGALIGKKQTYLLEVSDEHNNTLFIQLSNDGTYWNVNSAGIFKKKYSRRKPLIYTVPAVGKSTVTDTSEVNSGQSMGATAPAGNSSESKDSDKSAFAQTIDEKIAKAEEETDVNPTEGQKEAGNYKKGHVRIDGYDITIEQPKGSVRRGTDADGKQWEQKMNNTYGYIRGTEGVDGDHIDIFLSDNPTEGNVYVVDQVNPDGSFDEHKVMYGFNSADEARNAYLSNYEEGWQGLGTITEISKDEFKKWVNSSHRKTKPFAEYKSVKEDNNNIRFRETNNEVSVFALKHNLNEKDVEDYADYIRRGNLNGASRAFKEIRRKVRLDNQGANLGQFAKIFSPIEKELYERFGNIDELRQQYVQRTLDERNAMEAARKKAEEEAEAERRRLQEFQNMSSEQLDAEYMKAVEANDESRMRDLVNEAARRNGYGDVGSEYQGVGAWSAPSNPGYESDEERRAAVENDAPDVNITDIANGYSQQPSDYFTNLRAYGTDTAHGRESAEAINKAIDEVRNGKDPMVKVYRAVPKSVKEGKLRNGDWVTPSRKYAEMHGDNRLEGDYRIIEQEVPASQIWWDGNDINEWGFDDGKSYAYRNTKNNRKLNDLITRDDKGNIIPLSQRFNARKADVRYRNTENQAATDNIEDVNKQFNQQLEGLTEENADKVTLSLGRPSAVLRAAGVEDKPMKLYGNKVIKKMRKHGFTLAEIKDLPRAVADPIAVFNNYQKNGNRSILTELQIGDKHILVSVTVGKTGVDADFNIVSSVFGKGSNNVVDWINKGYATFINKEKALDYLHFSERSISEASDNQELVSTANIIRNFENPNVLEENLVPTEQTNDIDTAVADTANKLNIGVRVAHSIDEVNNDSVRRAIEQGRRIQGFYDTRTGEIVVYAPNAVDAEDAVRTVLHEGVAHYGLRQLVGEENFGTFLDNIYNNVSDELKQQIDAKAREHNWSARVATEEYLASLAEDTNFEQARNSGIWQKIKDFFMDLLTKAGIRLNNALSDNELRYILWRSYENLKEPGRYRSIIGEVRDITKQRDLNVGNYAVQNSSGKVAENNNDEINRIVEEAKANGTYMKAPNGSDTNLNERQWAQVRTKAFKDWFGDWENDPENASKVVDENGEPKVVYHGTNNDFTVFDWSKIGSGNDKGLRGKGIYLSPNIKTSQSYGNNVITAFVNIKKPFRTSDFTSKEEISDKLGISEFSFDFDTSGNLRVYSASAGLFTDALKEAGYDGIIYPQRQEVIVYSPNQIKSATDNTGAFSPEDDDIRYRFIGETGARNLDAAEEATTRLDNLSVAREMENAYNEKKARIEKLKDSKPVDVKYNGEYDLNRKPAKDWLKENVRGEYTNNDTGEKIGISKVGINEVTSHGSKDKAHLKSLIAIPQMIEQSIFIDEIPNTKGHDKYDSYKYYVCGLKIDNVDYIVKLVVGVKGDNKYYDHRLTEIEKGTLIDNLNGLSNSVAENQNANISYGKDTKLQSILQTNDRENARKIKLATGWERGADGKWRYETADFEYHPKGDARRNDKYKESEWYKELHVLEEKLFNGETLTDGETKRFDELSARVNAIRDNDRNTERIYLDDYVEDNELFKAYPELKQTKIDFVDLPNEEYSAKYNEEENRITVNQAKSIDDKSAIAHEVQHAIQHIEGFAKGSNVDNYNSVPTSENVINDIIDATDGHILDGGGFDNTPEGIFNALNRKTTYGTILRDYSSELDDIANKYGYETIFDLVNDIDKFKSRVEMYLSEAGEVEARNAERRMNMTPEQRRQSLASETEDVAREDQLFIYDNLGVNARQGTGALTDSELSNANDPAGKMLGKPSRTPAQQKAFAERERQRMADRAREVADILHLDNVEIVTDASILQGRRAKAKGFYSRDNGKIVIVVPNHVDMADIEQTVLHEAVAHYGLRKLFGSNFDTFINNVYNNADENVRREIVQLAAKHNWDFATATEEYLASLAESTNFEDMNASWWNKIKDLFLSMVRSIGLKGFSGKTLSDNELRYILWRSYENLKNPGRYRNVFSEAEDIAKQNELKVGNYAVRETRESVADNDLYREVEPEERRRVYVADIYDARIKNGMYQMREAVQDSMLSLREAMTEILKAEGNKNVKIEDIVGFENAYLGENRLSSVNKAEADAFVNLLFKPLLEEAANLSGSEKGGRDELVNYMMAKHGLERNKVMAERDAKNEYDNYVKEHPKGEKTLDDFIEKYRKRDYAGLTALTGKEKVAEAEAEAQQMVDDYEAEHDTEELWNKTRAVSNAILDKEYDTGLMSKDTMEKLKSMFDYYIPLRGFDEKTSEDEYAYLENKNSAFFAPIKAAKGRKSKADDPFAYLQGMAENAIMQGNRNKLVKQKFLNFVLNHQSDLASVSDLWLKYNEVNDEWEPVFPDNIKDTDTAKDVERKMQEFEERMQQLAEEEPELYKHGKQTVEVPYRVVESRDLKQHQILVRRNGRNYVITINGNPRAAQAVNGLTNPDNDMSGAIGAILKAGQNLNRQLSAFYTTRNPDFVVSNFIRDALYANSMAWVKEKPNYALRFHKNYVLANPIKMKKLFARYRKNKLKANSKTDMMFKQFMLNGGETGYASVRDIEKRKNEISKEIKKYQGKLPIKKAWGYLAERFDEFNRAVENSARFAAFVTSREMGRSIERSIYDAKEISVNFNKKGSGSKFMGATGQTKLGNAGAFISGLGRSGFVFWNAAIQGSTNFGRQVKRNPAKALTAMATMFMLGAVVASLGYGDDDDDDKNSYWNLPDYVRRSNIMFRAGDQWVSIPLPVEYRSLYGLGELMISTMSDKEHLSGEEIANQIAGQISQVMPIDFLEGGGGAKAFVPSFIKPFAEAYGYNRSWTGLPIYKDTPYNKDMPEWTKAYKSANKYLVDLSETLNEVTGGDKYTKGEIDINPAKIEHVLTGYFGGIANTIDRLTKMGETAIGQREYDPNSILIWNRIVKNGDERTEYKAINNEYFRIKEEHDKLKKRLNNYERDTENGVFDYAEKIDFLYNSPEYRRLEIYEEYQPDIEDLILMMKETNDADEQKDIEAQINELKKMMISDINKYARK